MLNSAFDAFTNVHTDYYPADLRAEIDRINDIVYPNVNNGVYRAGFATSARGLRRRRPRHLRHASTAGSAARQAALSRRAAAHRSGLAAVHDADSFRRVYYSHFKCNLRRIADYPNLWNYLRDLYQVPSVAETVSIEQIKRHYYGSQRQVNPTGIVPIGPLIDFDAPHDRGRLDLKGTEVSRRVKSCALNAA